MGLPKISLALVCLLALALALVPSNGQDTPQDYLDAPSNCQDTPQDYLSLDAPSNGQDTPRDYLDAHNRARAAVGVGPMTWNNAVANYAQNYANQRVANCDMVHSGGPYGENIAKSTGDLSGSAAVNLFVGEKVHYDYNSNSCVGGECRHYTQVVWRNSVQLGCAKVRCRNGGTFIGCNYNPPGNYNGQRPY